MCVAVPCTGVRPSPRRTVLRVPFAIPLVSLGVVGLGACGGADPPASVAADDAVADDVAAAATRAWSLLNEARLDPTDANKRSAAVAAYTGKSQDTVTELLSTYGVTGQASRTDEAAPATLVPYPDTVMISAEGDEATIEVCEVDSNILVQPGMAEDGGDVVVDGEAATLQLTLTLRLVDGDWLEADGEIVDREAGVTSCD